MNSLNTDINLCNVDQDIYKLLLEETDRQNTKLEMIASENYTSKAVLTAAGSILTNKYAEGYPAARYYGGCEVVDKIETLAIERAKALFNAEYANVQPHSGSSANMAVYMGFLNPGDKIVGMDLSQGGHLTHGSSVSFSGKQYDVAFYGVNKETERIDFNMVEDVVARHKPKIIIAGASAYPRIIDFPTFADIATRHGAMLLVDMAHIAGLVVAGEHPSPIPYADITTTTTHKTLRGPRGGVILVGKNRENIFGITTAKGNTRKYSAIINSTVFPGIQGGPLMHIIAAKAVAFLECQQESFKTYQQQVRKNATVLANTLQKGGTRIVSGGTDTHLVLLDLRPFEITGKEGEEWLDIANISTNKNAIPFDPNPPSIASGIRIGTPALTTRGLKEQDMEFIANKMLEVFKSAGNEEKLRKIAKEIEKFSHSFKQVENSI